MLPIGVYAQIQQMRLAGGPVNNCVTRQVLPYLQPKKGIAGVQTINKETA